MARHQKKDTIQSLLLLAKKRVGPDRVVASSHLTKVGEKEGFFTKQIITAIQK
jgi:hypothetical protein